MRIKGTNPVVRRNQKKNVSIKYPDVLHRAEMSEKIQQSLGQCHVLSVDRRSSSNVTAWKQGGQPTVGTVYRLAKQLEVDPSTLMDGWSRLDDYNDRYIDRIWDESEEETFIQLAERDHGPTVAEIIQMLIRLDKGKKCTAIADGTDLYLTDDDRFIPDVMIVCDPDKIKSDGVHGASDLVVEVLSPSTMRND